MPVRPFKEHVNDPTINTITGNEGGGWARKKGDAMRHLKKAEWELLAACWLMPNTLGRRELVDEYISNALDELAKENHHQRLLHADIKNRIYSLEKTADDDDLYICGRLDAFREVLLMLDPADKTARSSWSPCSGSEGFGW